MVSTIFAIEVDLMYVHMCTLHCMHGCHIFLLPFMSFQYIIMQTILVISKDIVFVKFYKF